MMVINMKPCRTPLDNKKSQIGCSITTKCCGQKRKSEASGYERPISEESESGIPFLRDFPRTGVLSTYSQTADPQKFQRSNIILIDQLLTEILIRLPSESVCQYKSVCKQWCGIICTSYFVRRYMNHHRQLNACVPNTSFTLVFQYRVQVFGTTAILLPVDAVSCDPVLSKSYKNGVNILSLPPLVKALDPKSPDPILGVLGSCHDLLLCYHRCTCSYYVVNLLTRHWIMIPSPKPNLEESSPLKRFVFHKAGFLCYDDDQSGGIDNKFTVILIPCVYFSQLAHFPPTPPEIYSPQFTVRMYSSESRQWTDFIVDWYPLSLNAYLSRSPILTHNGMFHWLNAHSLVSLNPFNGRDLNPRRLTHSVKLPDELVLKTREVFFGVCQGHFQIARVTREAGVAGIILRVWELEDYHKGVWKLAHRVLLHNSSLKRVQSTTYINLLAFHPFNKDIIFVGVVHTIYQFNLQTRRSEKYRKLTSDKGYSPNLASSVFTLFPQWFPTPVHTLTNTNAELEKPL